MSTCGVEDERTRQRPISDDLLHVMIPRMARDMVRMHTRHGKLWMDATLYDDAAKYFSRAMQVSDLVAGQLWCFPKNDCFSHYHEYIFIYMSILHIFNCCMGYSFFLHFFGNTCFRK